MQKEGRRGQSKAQPLVQVRLQRRGRVKIPPAERRVNLKRPQGSRGALLDKGAVLNRENLREKDWREGHHPPMEDKRGHLADSLPQAGRTLPER